MKNTYWRSESYDVFLNAAQPFCSCTECKTYWVNKAVLMEV